MRQQTFYEYVALALFLWSVIAIPAALVWHWFPVDSWLYVVIAGEIVIVIVSMLISSRLHFK